MGKRFLSFIISAVMILTAVSITAFAQGETASAAEAQQRQMEYLTRGAIGALPVTGGVYLSWRLLGSEPMDTVFNIYKNDVLLAENVNNTNYTDASGTAASEYRIAPVIGGTEGKRSDIVNILAGHADKGYEQSPYAYFDIPLSIPQGSGYTYNANDASVGDIDGDGEYEIFLKWDPSNSKDNSQNGVTGNVYIDCYKTDGALLWRIDLGRNIRAGAHYTQFQVYDYDGDGKAEIAMKTAPGSIDGRGNYVTEAGNTDAIRTADNSKSYVNSSGFIITGPEYLTIFSGATGAAMQTVEYDPLRGTTDSWGKSGDNTNRLDRFLAGTAYLDGVHPSLITCRGYYGKAIVVAYDWDGQNLKKRWKIDSTTSGNGALAKQGNHQISVADLDNDGFDEIVYGAAAIDHDGTLAHSMGWGHGDALHVSDFNNDGKQEIFGVLEEYPGEGFRTGEGKTIWTYKTSKDDGRGVMAYFSRKYGTLAWDGALGIRTLDGTLLTNVTTQDNNWSMPNFPIYWDGDLCREHFDGNRLNKWNDDSLSFGRILNFSGIDYNNTTKKNPCLQADLFGDWREELILRLADNSALRVFMSIAPTDYKFTTFMHDSQYRCAVAWQNTAYNQPPHQSYYIGYDKDISEYTQPDIYYASVPVNVTFNVKDSNDRLIDGAVVTVGSSSMETDANGAAALTLSEGTYEYKVYKPGYQTVISTADVKDGVQDTVVNVRLEARTHTKLAVSFTDESGNELKPAQDLGTTAYEPNKVYTLDDSYKEDITVGNAVYEYSADKSDNTSFILDDDITISLVFRKRTEAGAGDKFFYHTNLSSNGFAPNSVNYGYVLNNTAAADAGELGGVKYANYGIGTGSIEMPLSGKMTNGTIEFDMLYDGAQSGAIGGSVYGLTLMNGETAGNTIGLRYTSGLEAQYAVLTDAKGGASYGTAVPANKLLHYAVNISGGKMNVTVSDKESGAALKEFKDIELLNGVGNTKNIDKLAFNCGYYNPSYAENAGSVTLGLADVRAYQKLSEFKEVYNSKNDLNGELFKYDGGSGAALAFADGVWTFAQNSSSGGCEFYANLDPASDNKAVLKFTFNTGGMKDSANEWDWTGRPYSYDIQILDSEYKPGDSSNVVLGLYQQYKESGGVQEVQYYSALKSKTNVKNGSAFGSPNITARSSTSWALTISIDLDAQTADIEMRGTGTGSGVTPSDGYTISNIPVSASGVGAVRIASTASGKVMWSPKVSDLSYSKMVYPEVKTGISAQVLDAVFSGGQMSVRAALTNNNEQSETFDAVCAARNGSELIGADVYKSITIEAGETEEYNFSIDVGAVASPEIDFYFWSDLNSMVPIE